MSQVISSFHFFDIFTSLNIFTSFTIFSSLTLSLLEAIAHDVSPVAMFKINWPFWAIFCFCKICLNFTIDLIPPQETFNFSEVDFVFKIKMGLSYTILKCDRVIISDLLAQTIASTELCELEWRLTISFLCIFDAIYKGGGFSSEKIEFGLDLARFSTVWSRHQFCGHTF